MQKFNFFYAEFHVKTLPFILSTPDSSVHRSKHDTNLTVLTFQQIDTRSTVRKPVITKSSNIPVSPTVQPANWEPELIISIRVNFQIFLCDQLVVSISDQQRFLAFVSVREPVHIR